MMVYPKATMTKEEFGEILAEFIQKSRKLKSDQRYDIHVLNENGDEINTIDLDDMFGLICAIGAVMRRFEPAIIKQYGKFDDYGLDIYDKRDGKKLLQIDRNIHKKGVDDVRFNVEIFGDFGFSVPVLDMVRNYMVSFYDNKD